MNPRRTVEHVRRFMPVMGITRIANVTGLDGIGIPVTVVCRPNSRSVAVFQGKGETLAAAEASGLMEAVETFHAERITLPLKLASYEELRYTHDLVEIDGLPSIKSSHFHAHLPILWIEGRELLNDRLVWLPFELVHTNYTRPLPPGSGCFYASSNGLASGNHLSEAIIHGICEVVERDAVALWSQLSRAEQNARRIRLETVSNPACRNIIAQFDAADLDVAIWDTTTDVGIPAVLCWVTERGRKERWLDRPSVGAGCHTAREVALSRALCEAAQERLTLISGARDTLKRSFYDEKTISGVFEVDGVRDFSALPSWGSDTCEDDVETLLNRLRCAGIEEVVMVDLSMDVFRNIAVVRIVIPGLEGIFNDAKYLPGARAKSPGRHVL